MNKQIFSDAEARPDLFLWNESIDRSSLKEWLAENHWQIPDDLFSFWQKTGGGIFTRQKPSSVRQVTQIWARMFLKLMRNSRTGTCRRNFWSFTREQADSQQ